MEVLRNLGRPPFANYDLVVYFGGGLFCLPLVYRYLIHPFGIPLPAFVMNASEQVTLELVRALSILIAVYVLGHLIAYLSSQLIEKAVDRFLGKLSTAIIVSLENSKRDRNKELKKIFKGRIKGIIREKAYISAAVRLIFHAPNVFHYLIVYSAGIFGYLDTRIPPKAFDVARVKYALKVIPGSSIRIDQAWYKSLEYYVINNRPECVPRMYNYLVMAGLFRSLSFIFLWSAWFVIVYLITYSLRGTWPLGLTERGTGAGAGLLEWFSLSTLSVFSLVSYLKFQRRYAEEAIMALAFAKDPS